MPFWLLRGLPYAKAQLYKHVAPNPEILPYREDVISFIMQEREKGRTIILATGSLQQHADAIAGYLGIFDEAYGTYENINLRGKNKAQMLYEKFGQGGFDYIGNSGQDIDVWKIADKSMIVEPGTTLLRKARRQSNIDYIFEIGESRTKLFFKEMRAYQWVKNLLLFLPFILAHTFELSAILACIAGFFAFSFVSSGVYIINDLLDLDTDRRHPDKKKRPFASGKLSIISGFMFFPFLLLAGFAISYFMLPLTFTLVLLLYFSLTTLYSIYLKKLYVMDIIILSALYTLRLIAGGYAADVEISTWLLEFSIFLFLSLAALKRYTEISATKESSKIYGRGYEKHDLNVMEITGIASGLLSVLVFTFYTNSPEIAMLYSSPKIMIGVVPFLIYWLTRLWIRADRGTMASDPIVFAVKDKVSYLVFVCIFAIIFLAYYY